MKWNNKLCIAAIASLAVALPISAFSDEGKKDEKKQGKKENGGQQHGGKSVQQQNARASAPSFGKSNGGRAHNQGAANNASNGQGRSSHESTQSAQVQRSQSVTVSPQSVQQSSRAARSQGNQAAISAATVQGVQQNNRAARGQWNQPNVQAVNSQSVQSGGSSARSQRNHAQGNPNQQQYTKSNNYGGLWYSGNTHGDWNRSSQHYWNNHNYRWYDGGWLIIDAGFSPSYSPRSSVASDVQIRLTDQGYYRGPIDGNIGPGSRNAIANYQGDHDLRVTGQINDALLQSLQLY